MVAPVDLAKYFTFLGVMAVMAITPGPANLFAIALGASRGRQAALVGVAGMNLATLTWFVAAAFGLSALVLAFPDVFRIAAWAGAAYLVWLGVMAIVSAFNGRIGKAHVLAAPSGPAFRAGFAVQIANPKALLFFSAVLPPFVDLERPMAAQMACFAAAVIGMDGLAMTAYGLGGAALAERMTRPRFRRIFSAFVGVLLTTAAVLIVLNH